MIQVGCYGSALRICHSALQRQPPSGHASGPAVGVVFAGTRLRLAKNVTVHNEPKDGS